MSTMDPGPSADRARIDITVRPNRTTSGSSMSSTASSLSFGIAAGAGLAIGAGTAGATATALPPTASRAVVSGLLPVQGYPVMWNVQKR